MKSTLAIIVILLFCFSYRICNLVYPDACDKGTVEAWWDLRMNLYALIIGGSFFLAISHSHKRIFKLIMSIGIGLSISDIIDRVVYNQTGFADIDYLIIPLTIITSWWIHYKQAKK